MKFKLATTCFVIGSALAPIAAYAADSDTDRSKPVVFVKDSVITTKIKTKLAAEHPGSLKHVRVDTDMNGVVWMTARPTPRVKWTRQWPLRAAPRASNRSTANSPSRRTAEVRLERGRRKPTLKSAQIDAEAFAGNVQSGGFVSSATDRKTVLDAVRKVEHGTNPRAYAYAA